MDEVKLNRRFYDILARKPEGECAVPECRNAKSPVMYACDSCAHRWDREKGPSGTNDFRVWIVLQSYDAERVYAELREEDP